MKISNGLSLAIVVSLAPATPSLARSASLVLSCHEMVGGTPSEEATIYRLNGDRLYQGDVLISQQGTPVQLSVFGTERRLGVHRLSGNTLVRTVLVQRPGKPSRRVTSETFDFSARTIRDAAGADSCHASGG